jgi:hypothetical protein
VRRATCIGAILTALLAASPADAAPGALIVYARRTATIPAHHARTLTVKCPGGRVITGGGALTSPVVRLTKSAPPDYYRWSVTAVNPTRSSQTLTVVADCFDQSKIPGSTVATAPTTATAPAGGTTTFTSPCGIGSSAPTSGGFKIGTSDLAVRIQASKPTAAQDGWTFAIFNGSSTDAPFTYQSVCLLFGSVSFVTSAPKDVPARTSRTQTVACPTGQPGGGGFDAATNGTSTISSTRPTGLAAHPPGKGWAVTARAGAVTEPLTTFAECVSP